MQTFSVYPPSTFFVAVKAKLGALPILTCVEVVCGQNPQL